MTNALYRIISSCFLPMVEDLVERRVGEYHFGARKGKSCAQATLELMDKMEDLKRRKGGGYTIHFDMTNAFSSVPIPLLVALVEMLGAPANFCRMLEAYLRKSRVLKKGDESEGWFYPISGVKQGCPLLPGLSVLVIDVVLQKLIQKVEAMVAFVDDVACVVESQEDVARILVFVQDEMQKVGLSLNWDRTVVQPLGDKQKFLTAVFLQKGHE